MSKADAGQEVQKRVTQYREQNPDVKTYEQAMSAVFKADPRLAREYAGESLVSNTPIEADQARWRNALGLPDPQERQSAGIQIDKLVNAEIAKNPVLSRMQALKIVLTAHPDLAREYRGIPSFDAVMGGNWAEGI